MIGSGIIGVLAALAITLGMLALAIRLLRKLQSRGGWGAPGIALKVLQRVPLGPKQSVALVQVADRVLVVSVAESGASLLAELTEPALSEALSPTAPARPAAALPAGWFRAIRRVTRGEGPGAPDDWGREAGSRRGAPPPDRGRALPNRAKRFGRVAPLGPWVLIAALALPPAIAQAQTPPAPRTSTVAAPAPAPGFAVRPPAPPKVDLTIGEGDQELHLSGAVGLVVLMGVLTLLPAMFLLMTSFTRILIVLHFVRSALGAQTTPPGQLLAAIAVLLTGVVMNPVLQETNRSAIQPYLSGEIGQVEAYRRAVVPFREFMLANTRSQDLQTFTELSGVANAGSMDEVPTVTVVSAFVTSELRTAFQMGFVIFLPFIVVDVIVASVLMSLGMFMLPPAMISLPFKLLLFVLADGWTLVVQNLVASFR